MRVRDGDPAQPRDALPRAFAIRRRRNAQRPNREVRQTAQRDRKLRPATKRLRQSDARRRQPKIAPAQHGSGVLRPSRATSDFGGVAALRRAADAPDRPNDLLVRARAELDRRTNAPALHCLLIHLCNREKATGRRAPREATKA
jgi:hypothetical protein